MRLNACILIHKHDEELWNKETYKKHVEVTKLKLNYKIYRKNHAEFMLGDGSEDSRFSYKVAFIFFRIIKKPDSQSWKSTENSN